MSASEGQVTRILQKLSGGDDSAAAEVLPLVYDELRALAASFFARQPPGHTLQPTALVHEAYLKLAGAPGARWEDRAHFLAVAARAMRQVLINHARDRAAAKRGGGWQRITLKDAVTAPDTSQEIDLLVLDEALEKLGRLS